MRAAAPLHLLSWNVFGSPVAKDPLAAMERIARYIDARAFDVVLLQEVWTAEQLDAFDRLASYQALYANMPRGWPLPRKGGLVALVREGGPWQVQAEPRFHEFAAEAPDALLWQGDGIADKGVERIEIAHVDTGARVVLFNTHFQSDYDPRSLFDFVMSKISPCEYHCIRDIALL